MRFPTLGSFQELAEKVVLLQGQEVFYSLATCIALKQTTSLSTPPLLIESSDHTLSQTGGWG